MSLFKKLFSAPQAPPPEARQLGRNQPCWCGSGEKYKSCHLESDRDYFAKLMQVNCNRFG